MRNSGGSDHHVFPKKGKYPLTGSPPRDNVPYMKHRTTLTTLLSVLLLAVLLVAPASAQESAQSSDEVISVNTRLVNVTVQVADKSGRVRTVAPSDLRILADGQLQETAYADAEAPSHVAFLVDGSASMRGENASRVRDAIRDFIRAADPRNTYTLMTFNERVTLLGRFSEDRDSLKEILKTLTLQPMDGSTALYDACAEAVSVIRREARQRKPALVVFTDGVDNASKLTKERLAPILDAFSGTLYIVVLDPNLLWLKYRWGAKSPEGTLIVEQLARALNARALLAHSPDRLRDISEEMAKSLLKTVKIGFYPAGEASRPGSHALQVQVAVPALTASTRSQYFVE